MHQSNNTTHNQFIDDIAWGPLATVKTWPIYFVNGYKFHTTTWSGGKSTANNGVCVKGTDYGQCEHDYYGTLDEIVQLEYPGEPIKRIVLFKCKWFDPTLNTGTRVHKHHGIVEVNLQRSYSKYEPFIIAQQAVQVYYMPYPEKRRDNSNWSVVIKTKARSTIDARGYEISHTHAYQEVENVEVFSVIPETEEITNLRDKNDTFEVVDGSQVNGTYSDEENSVDNEMENEEVEEEYDDSSTNEDVPDDYVEYDNDDDDDYDD